jgi:hypothetical protein
METGSGFLGPLEGDFVGFLKPGGPPLKNVPRIIPIGPNFLQPLNTVSEIPPQHRFDPLAVIAVGGGDGHDQNQSEGVDPHRTFAPFDLFPPS